MFYLGHITCFSSPATPHPVSAPSRVVLHSEGSPSPIRSHSEGNTPQRPASHHLGLPVRLPQSSYLRSPARASPETLCSRRQQPETVFIRIGTPRGQQVHLAHHIPGSGIVPGVVIKHACGVNERLFLSDTLCSPKIVHNTPREAGSSTSPRYITVLKGSLCIPLPVPN